MRNSVSGGSGACLVHRFLLQSCSLALASALPDNPPEELEAVAGRGDAQSG